MISLEAFIYVLCRNQKLNIANIHKVLGVEKIVLDNLAVAISHELVYNFQSRCAPHSSRESGRFE